METQLIDILMTSDNILFPILAFIIYRQEKLSKCVKDLHIEVIKLKSKKWYVQSVKIILVLSVGLVQNFIKKIFSYVLIVII